MPPKRGTDGKLLSDSEKAAWVAASKAAWGALNRKGKDQYLRDPEFRAEKRLEQSRLQDDILQLTNSAAIQNFPKMWDAVELETTGWLPGSLPNPSTMINNLALARTENKADLKGIPLLFPDHYKQRMLSVGPGGPNEMERNNAQWLSNVFDREKRIAAEEVHTVLSINARAGGAWVDTDYYNREEDIIKGEAWQQRLLGRSLGTGLAALFSRRTSVTLRPGVDAHEQPETSLLQTRTDVALSEFRPDSAVEYILDAATPTFVLSGAINHAEQALHTMDTSSETYKYYMGLMYGDRDMLVSLTKEQRPIFHNARIAALFPFGVSGTHKLAGLTPAQKDAILNMPGEERLRITGLFWKGFWERLNLLTGAHEYEDTPGATISRYRNTQKKELLAAQGYRLAMDYGTAHSMAPRYKKRFAVASASLFLLPEFVMADGLTLFAYVAAKGIGKANAAWKATKSSPEALIKMADELDAAHRAERIALVSGTEEEIAEAIVRTKAASDKVTTGLAKHNVTLAHLLSIHYASATEATGHYMHNVNALSYRTRRYVERFRKLARELDVPDAQIDYMIVEGSHLATEITRAAYVRNKANRLVSNGTHTRFEAVEQATKEVKLELAAARKAAREAAPPYEIYKMDGAAPGVVEYYIKDSSGNWHKWFTQDAKGEFALVDPTSTKVLDGGVVVPNAKTGKVEDWQIQLTGLGPRVEEPLGAVPNRWDTTDFNTVRQQFATFFAEKRLATFSQRRSDGKVALDAGVHSGKTGVPSLRDKPTPDDGRIFSPDDNKWYIINDEGKKVEVRGPKNSVTSFMSEAQNQYDTALEARLAAEKWWLALSDDPLPVDIFAGLGADQRRALAQAQKQMLEAQLENAHAEKLLSEALQEDWVNRVGPQHAAWKQAAQELPKVQSRITEIEKLTDAATPNVGKGIIAGTAEAIEYNKGAEKLQDLANQLIDAYEAGEDAGKLPREIATLEAAQAKLAGGIEDVRAGAMDDAKALSDLLIEHTKLLQRRSEIQRILTTAENAALRRERLSAADPMIQELLDQATALEKSINAKGVDVATKAAGDVVLFGIMAKLQARLQKLEGVASKASTTQGARVIDLSEMPIALSPRTAEDGTRILDYDLTEAGVATTLDDAGYQVGDTVKLPSGESAQISSKEWSLGTPSQGEETLLSEVWVLSDGSRVRGIAASVTHDNLLQKGMVLRTRLPDGTEILEEVMQANRVGDEYIEVTLRSNSVPYPTKTSAPAPTPKAPEAAPTPAKVADDVAVEDLPSPFTSRPDEASDAEWEALQKGYRMFDDDGKPSSEAAVRQEIADQQGRIADLKKEAKGGPTPERSKEVRESIEEMLDDIENLEKSINAIRANAPTPAAKSADILLDKSGKPYSAGLAKNLAKRAQKKVDTIEAKAKKIDDMADPSPAQLDAADTLRETIVPVQKRIDALERHVKALEDAAQPAPAPATKAADEVPEAVEVAEVAEAAKVPEISDSPDRVVAIELSPGSVVKKQATPTISIDDLLESSQIIVTTPIRRRMHIQEGWLLEGYDGAQRILARAARKSDRKIKALEKQLKKAEALALKYGDEWVADALASLAAAKFDLATQQRRMRGISNTVRKIANDITTGRKTLEDAPVVSEKFIDLLKGAVIDEPASSGWLRALFRKVRGTAVTGTGELTYTINPAKLREILVEAWGEKSVALLLKDMTTTAGSTRGGGASDVLSRLLLDSLDEAGVAEYNKVRDSALAAIEARKVARAKLAKKMATEQDGDKRVRLGKRIAKHDKGTEGIEVPPALTASQRAGDAVISLEDFSLLQSLGEQLRRVWKLTHENAEAIITVETLKDARKAVWTLIGSDRSWAHKLSKSVRKFMTAFNPLAFELGSLSDDMSDVIKGGINLIDETGSEIAGLIKVALRSSSSDRTQQENAKRALFDYLGSKAPQNLRQRAPFKLVAGIRPELEKFTWVNTTGEGTLLEDAVAFILQSPDAYPGGLDGLIKGYDKFFTDANDLFNSVLKNPLVGSALRVQVKKNGLGADLHDAIADLAVQVQSKTITPDEATAQLRSLANERPVGSAGISSDPRTWQLRPSDAQSSNPMNALYLSPLGHGTPLSLLKGQQQYFYKAAHSILREGVHTKSPELLWKELRSLYLRDHPSVGYTVAREVSEAVHRVGDLRGLMMFTEALASAAMRKRIADLVIQVGGARILPDEAAAANKIIGDGMSNWDELTPEEITAGLSSLNRLGVPVQQAEAPIKGARGIEHLEMDLTAWLQDPQGRLVFTPRALGQRLDNADPFGMIKSTDMTTTQARIGAVVLGGRNFSKMWRTSVVTGLFHPRLGYFYNNFYGDVSQIHLTLGMRQSMNSNVSFLRGIPTWFSSVNSMRSRIAKRLGIDRDSVLPGIRASLHQPDLAAIFQGKHVWLRTRSGQLTSSTQLKDAAIRFGVMESYANQDLMKFVTQLAQSDKPWTKVRNSVTGWQNDISDFATYVQQRQRFALMTDLHTQGYTLEAAAKKTLDAVYDWKFGLARWEAAAFVPFIPFYRFWRLSLAQQMRENLRLMSRPPKEVIMKALAGQTAFGRTRAQQQALKALPYMTDPIMAEDMKEYEVMREYVKENPQPHRKKRMSELTHDELKRYQKKAAGRLTAMRANKIGATWMGNARGFTTYRYSTAEERAHWYRTKGTDDYDVAFKTTGPNTGVEALNLIMAMSQVTSVFSMAIPEWLFPPKGTVRATISKKRMDLLLGLLWPHQKGLLELRLSESGQVRDGYTPTPYEFNLLTMLDRKSGGMLDLFTERGKTPADASIGWKTMMALRYSPPSLEIGRFLAAAEKTPELQAMIDEEGMPVISAALENWMAYVKTNVTGGTYPGSLEKQKARSEYEMKAAFGKMQEEIDLRSKPRTPTEEHLQEQEVKGDRKRLERRDELKAIIDLTPPDGEFSGRIQRWWKTNIGGTITHDKLAQQHLLYTNLVKDDQIERPVVD